MTIMYKYVDPTIYLEFHWVLTYQGIIPVLYENFKSMSTVVLRDGMIRNLHWGYQHQLPHNPERGEDYV